MKEQLQKCDAEIFELNEKIMDLKTELYIAEARKEELYSERNEIIAELSRFNQLNYTTKKVQECINIIKKNLRNGGEMDA